MNGAIIICTSNRIISTSSRIIRTGQGITFTKALRIIPSTWIAIPGAVPTCTFDVLPNPGDGISRPSAVQTIRASVLTLRGDALTIPFDVRITLDDVQERTSTVLDGSADELSCIVDLPEIRSNLLVCIVDLLVVSFDLPVCIADGKKIPSPLQVCIADVLKIRAEVRGCMFDEPTCTSTIRPRTDTWRPSRAAIRSTRPSAL